MRSLRDEIIGLREEVRALTTLVEQLSVPRKTPRQVRLEKRHQMIVDLAQTIGPISWNTALEVEAIIDGRCAAPKGQERNVQLLQQDPEAPKSEGGIWRVLKDHLQDSHPVA